MKITAVTKSPDDTRELAAAIAGLTKKSDTLLLAGDLGAGKTTFTQGFGRALGVEGPITSPTFTLMHHYRAAAGVVLHADVYRLGHLQEIIDLGLSELIDDGAIALIEWGDVAAPVLPADFLEIHIGFREDTDEADDERRLQVRPVGARWAVRVGALNRALERWIA